MTYPTDWQTTVLADPDNIIARLTAIAQHIDTSTHHTYTHPHQHPPRTNPHPTPHRQPVGGL